MKLRELLSSLRIRVVLLVVLASLPMLGLFFATALRQAKDALARAQEQEDRFATLVASEQGRIATTARQALGMLAQLPAVRGNDATACRAVLSDIQRAGGTFTDLGVVEADGDVWCSAVPWGADANIAEKPFFRRAIQQGKFIAGADPASGAGDRPGVTFAQPIPGEHGEPWRLVFADVELSWLPELARDAGLPEDVSITILDASGTILARHPDGARFIGEQWPPEAYPAPGVHSASTPGLDADGIRKLLEVRSLGLDEKDDAKVVVGFAEDSVRRPAQALLARNALGLLVVTGLAIVAAVIGSNVLVRRRLDLLRRAADEWSRGNLAHRASVSGHDEISRVAPALNAMADRLGTLLSEEHAAREALAREVERLVDDRTRDIGLLNHASELLQACVTTTEAHDVIARVASRLFPGTSGAVLGLEPSGDLAIGAASWGGLAPQPAAFPHDACWALRRGRTHFVRGNDGPSCSHATLERGGQSLCVPLVAQGQSLGVLSVMVGAADLGAAGLDIERRRVVETLAEQCALALANLQLRDRLRRQSLCDPLTGLPNRRHAAETLERELESARRSETPLSLVLMDIDHFKRINDTHGHDAGDAVLRDLADLLVASMKPGQMASRHGGEEFLLILPHASRDAAVAVADGIRRELRQRDVRHGGREIGPVTLSAGVATLGLDGNTAPELVSSADLALYAAKSNGRDRVETAGPHDDR